jgi:sugar/nucleoside kinase (ribokinase family)
MPELLALHPVDYVVVGHIACDKTPQGCRLGGTASYSGLTASALGLRVGIVTSFGMEIPLEFNDGIHVHNILTKNSTTFENVYLDGNRVQHIYHRATDLVPAHVPEVWRQAPILHVGPIAQEAKSVAANGYSGSLLGFTPQGWMRSWDGEGRIHPVPWQEAEDLLPKAGAVVLSVEDVGGDEDQIEKMAAATRVLAVTEGPCGARLYWNGDLRRFLAPRREEVDATGAGDIFATCFFWRLYVTRDPWEAARFATQVASFSVLRPGLEGVPTREEIQHCLMEVI